MLDISFSVLFIYPFILDKLSSFSALDTNPLIMFIGFCFSPIEPLTKPFIFWKYDFFSGCLGSSFLISFFSSKEG